MLSNIEIFEDEYSEILHKLVQTMNHDKRFSEISYRSRLSIVKDILEKNLIENKLRFNSGIDGGPIPDLNSKYIRNSIESYLRMSERPKIKKIKPIDIFKKKF